MNEMIYIVFTAVLAFQSGFIGGMWIAFRTVDKKFERFVEELNALYPELE